MRGAATDRDGIAHRLLKPTTVFLVVTVLGGFGYHTLEGWSFLDSLYMSVITVTTLGLQEVRPLGNAGRLFTIFLVIFGIGAFTYFATAVANYVIAGELRGYLGQRKMQKEIEQCRDHYIICGFGRMGFQVADEFKREGSPLVVLDKSPSAVQRAVEHDHLALLGNAGDDDVLRQAGIERARGLVAAIDNDAENLMVVLSARTLNDKLFIVARCNLEMTESKLVAAGANRVLSLYGVGGRRIAQMALRPNVVEFLEVVMHDEELEMWLEEVKLATESKLDGCCVGAAKLRESTGASIVALRQRNGKTMVAPTPETVLQAGDIIVALGTREQLNELRKLSV